jgi:hypothetical protein
VTIRVVAAMSARITLSGWPSVACDFTSHGDTHIPLETTYSAPGTVALYAAA